MGGAPSTQNVVIIGGGYAGVAVARQLDAHMSVTLIEPREIFVHHLGMLRAYVDKDYAPQIIIPYDKLLKRGKIIHDKVRDIADKSITTLGGQTIEFDYLVVASGQPNPHKAPSDVLTKDAFKKWQSMAQEAIVRARTILVVGGGPVGVELAGEIKTEFPDKKVRLVSSGGIVDNSVPPMPDKFIANLTQKLKDVGVEVTCNARVDLQGEDIRKTWIEGEREWTINSKDKEPEKFMADLVFLAVGGPKPSSEHLGILKNKTNDGGFIKADEYLRVQGCDNIFVLGDASDIVETKLAAYNKEQAVIVAANIRKLAANDRSLKPYKRHRSPIMVVPVGRHGGVSQLPYIGLWGDGVTRTLKSKTLFLEMFKGMLNQK